MSTELESERIWVVDQDNRPLAVMSADQVHDQDLRHRGFFLLVSDPGGRLIVRRLQRDHPLYPGRWDIAGRGHVLASEASEEAALRHLPPAAGDPDTLRHLLTLDRGAGTGREIVEVFGAVIPEAATVELTRDPQFMAVDPDELAALAATFPDQLTPALLAVWTARLHAPAT